MRVLIYLFCVLNFFCNKKNKEVVYYKDFDFVNLVGIEKIDNNEFNKVLEVYKSKDKLTLKVTSTDIVAHSHNLDFYKKEDYFEYNSEYKVEDPSEYVKEVFYLKNGIGMKFFLSFYNNKPNYCKVSEVNFKKNEIREVFFEEKHIQPSPDLMFNELKENKSASTFSTTNVYEENGKIKKVWNEFNFVTKENYNSVSYYEGYPDSKISQFHNLFRYYFGKEIR